MHIRIVHQYFRTPEDGGSQRSYLLARELAENGFRVSVITATNEDRARVETINGVEIHYLPVYYSNHLSFKSRILAFFRFVMMAVKKIRRLPRPDINYIISTPLTTGIVALYDKLIRGVPYIFEAGDLWPAAPIELGVLKNPVIKSTAVWLEKISYRNASLMVGLSGPISDHMMQISGREEVITVTNFSDPGTLVAQRSEDEVRRMLGIPPGAFIITYAGTIGLANHLEYLIDLAAVMPPESNVWFIVMGDGAQKERIRSYAKHHNVARMIFLEKGSRQQVADVMGASQALYISFYRAQVLETGCPNKFFDALALGKMVILNFGGWLADLCTSEGIGFSYDPCNPDEAIEKLRPYLDQPGAELEAGRRARQIGESRFTTKKQLEPLISWLRKNKKAG